MCVGHPRDSTRTRVGVFHSVRIPARSHQCPRTASRTAVCRPGSEHAPWPFRSTAYSVWFRSHRIRTVPRCLEVAHSSTAAYNIGDPPICSRSTRHSSADRIRVDSCHTVSFELTDGLLISDSPLMVGETSLVPEMCRNPRMGIRSPVATHGGLAKQQLLVWSHVWDTSLQHPLPHALHIYFLAMAAGRFPIT